MEKYDNRTIGDSKRGIEMTSDMKSVCISHNGIDVTFYSTDYEEINAIINCFGHFWTVKDSLNTVAGWSVVSHQVSTIEDIIDVNKLTFTTGLFKNASVMNMVVKEKHYFLHNIQNVACLTCIDLENNTTHFYHEHKINEYSYIRNLVREPIAAKYQESGYITMHASACSIDGKGILMPGFKGAGKSTLLSHLLEGGASYIGNDAVLCKNENDSIILTAYPQCIRLSKETVQNNGPLSEYFNNAEHYDFINNKIEFLPSLLDSIFTMHHLSFVSKMELIIIPSIDFSKTDYSIEFSDNNEYLSLLQKSTFYQYHSYVWSPFFHELNDPLIDISSFANVFHSMPRICILKYGILDAKKKNELFCDISNIVLREKV
ncbi:hypothetical protein [Paenibacillus sp. NPDC057967]|uniref:hypothetical protein n=1 Tax=Paenibacillus sp. NPDC057967 TaxID=3346293 RepID=UPI0036DD9D07